MIAEFLQSVDAREVRVSVCAATGETGSDGSCGQKDSVKTQLKVSGFAKDSPLDPLRQILINDLLRASQGKHAC